MKDKQCADNHNVAISKGGVCAVEYRRSAPVKGGQMGPLHEPSDKTGARGK